MLKPTTLLLLTTLFALVFLSCKKTEQTRPLDEPRLNFIYKFDSTQPRLNNLGQPAAIGHGRKAQSPKFNLMSSHYIELTKDQFTPLGGGAVLYRAAETSVAGQNAIDFSKASLAGQNQVFFSMPLKNIAPGTYKWLRVSLAYQNYTVKLRAQGQTLDGTIASFIGFRNYIQSFKIKDSTMLVNSNKNQGFWAFEASTSGIGIVTSGQAPAGATTVPNPLFATSPIPQGSCVVTGQFANGLTITGNETTDINVIVSLSTNNSFEWIDADGNNSYDPLNGDQVVDMGIRGLIPIRL
jgi:hypothetical protein